VAIKVNFVVSVLILLDKRIKFSLLCNNIILICNLKLLQTEVKKAQPREVMQSLQGGRGRAGRTLAGRGFCKYSRT